MKKIILCYLIEQICILDDKISSTDHINYAIEKLQSIKEMRKNLPF